MLITANNANNYQQSYSVHYQNLLTYIKKPRIVCDDSHPPNCELVWDDPPDPHYIYDYGVKMSSLFQNTYSTGVTTNTNTSVFADGGISVSVLVPTMTSNTSNVVAYTTHTINLDENNYLSVNSSSTYN